MSLNARDRLVRALADVVLLGVIVNLVALIAAPVLRPDLNLLEKSLSYYTVGPWGAVQTIAFAALGIASAALGIALWHVRMSSRLLAPVVVLLIVSGAASLGLVRYPMGAAGPTTFLGDAHQTAGTIGGVAQLVAALAFAIAIRTEPAWRNLFVIALLAFFIALAGALVSQVAIWWPHLGLPMGAAMRLLVVPLVTLWGLVALHLRRTSEH